METQVNLDSKLMIIDKEIYKVFESNPDLPNHRNKYPWVTGFLGDLNSRIIFLAENPSLTQIKKHLAIHPHHDIECQWNVSPGDHIFRDALFEARFKEIEPRSKGGWKCYITNVVKMADHAGKWKRLAHMQRFDITLKFASVLRMEIDMVDPLVIVLMGKEVERYFKELKEQSVVTHTDRTEIEHVKHYGYFNYGPLNDSEVKEYKEDFQRIRGVYDSLISHA